MRYLVPPGQRAYVASHPLGVLLSAGIAFTGWVNILFPSVTAESSSSLIFSPMILFLFNLAWAVGGTLSVVGLLRGKARIEGVGMSLLASALGSYYLAVVSIRLSAAVSAGFVVALAIGCALRAYHLANHAYVNLDVPHEHIPK